MKVSEPAAVPVGPEGLAVVSGQREPRKSGWWIALHQVRDFSLPAQMKGTIFYSPEFDAILALETKAVLS